MAEFLVNLFYIIFFFAGLCAGILSTYLVTK